MFDVVPASGSDGAAPAGGTAADEHGPARPADDVDDADEPVADDADTDPTATKVTTYKITLASALQCEGKETAALVGLCDEIAVALAHVASMASYAVKVWAHTCVTNDGGGPSIFQLAANIARDALIAASGAVCPPSPLSCPLPTRHVFIVLH